MFVVVLTSPLAFVTVVIVVVIMVCAWITVANKATPMIEVSFLNILFYSFGFESTGGSFKRDRVSLAATPRPSNPAAIQTGAPGMAPFVAMKATPTEPLEAIINAVTALAMTVMVFMRRY